MSGGRTTELCEKLRKWVDCKHDMVAGHGFSWLYELTSKEKNELLKIADEIEGEIERDYMKLPVDAEGVPWRDGETIFVNPNGDECRLVSLSFSFIRHTWLLEGEIIKKPYDIQRCYAPDECRHAKPRTLTVEQVREAIDDVLHDVVSLCFNTWKKPSAFSSYDVEDVMASGNMDEFAKELHELMEVGK